MKAHPDSEPNRRVAHVSPSAVLAQSDCRVESIQGRTHGFTLLELVMVIGVLGVLGGLLLPALAKARARANQVACLNNLRQLDQAWLTYAEENRENLAPNTSRSLNLIQTSVANSWILGNARWDRSGSNLAAGCLFGYVGRSERVYHCPTDKSLTAGPASRIPRTRSYSLDSWLNGDIQGKGLNGSPQTVSVFKTSLQQLARPSDVFTFLDEQEDSIDDGFFAIHDPVHWHEKEATSELRSWMELPADRHERGCNLSFADGHAERWHWKAPKQFREYEQLPAEDNDKADLQLLQSKLPNP